MSRLTVWTTATLDYSMYNSFVATPQCPSTFQLVGEPGNEAEPHENVGARRSSVRRGSAAATGDANVAAARGSQARRGSAAATARGSVDGGAAVSVGMRGSASRPNSHNSRLSHSASTKPSQERCVIVRGYACIELSAGPRRAKSWLLFFDTESRSHRGKRSIKKSGNLTTLY